MTTSEQTFAFEAEETIYSWLFLYYAGTTNLLVTAGICILTVVLVLYYIVFRKMKGKVPLPRISLGPQKPRFRKRDKVLFYGRKMLRRVRSFARIGVPSTRRSGTKKRHLEVMKIAKRLLQFRKEKLPQRLVCEPPPSLLEDDWPENRPMEPRLPPEVLYMLKSTRVLGYFETPIFLELCRFMESRHLSPGQYLFRAGDMDDSIYVVESGRINLFIADLDEKERFMKEVKQGESIHSLLSILDVLTGHVPRHSTVVAQASVDTNILRLPVQALHLVLQRYPESLVRVVQIINVRLQRVTFLALHNYLGLSVELMNDENQADKTLLIHSLHNASAAATNSSKNSPLRRLNTYDGSHDREARRRRLHSVDDDDNGASLESSLSSTEFNERRHRHSSGMNTRTDHQSANTTLTPDDSTPAPQFLTVGSAPSSTPLGGELAPTASQPIAIVQPVSQSAGGLRSATRPSAVAFKDDSSEAGSPPMRQTPDDGSVAMTAPRRSLRRAVLTDQVSVIGTELSHDMAPTPSVDDTTALQLAITDLTKLLGLRNESLLRDRCLMRRLKAETTLIKQGDQDSSLFFVITGQLQAQQQAVGSTEHMNRVLFFVHPGEIVGGLAVLAGEPSFFTIRTRRDSIIVTITKDNFYAIMKEHPQVVLNLGHSVVKRMSSFVRQMDFFLDWMYVEAGRAVFKQGEVSDSLYIVLNGRLRSVITRSNGKKELVGEHGRGELIGLVEVLTLKERATTVLAVRDTELTKIPDEVLNYIKWRYPQIVTRLIHLLGERILGSLQGRSTFTAISEQPASEPAVLSANLATVAILPVSDDVPLKNFTKELHHALSAIGPTLKLSNEIILKALGSNALDSVNDYRLSSWIAQQEDIHRIVLFECDTRMTQWTRRCITQADCILIVALGEQEPMVGQIERHMENLAVRAQKDLVLLYHDDGARPRNTIQWLNMRGWCRTHHHIRCPNRVFSKQAKARQLYHKLAGTVPDRMSDFSRLARVLTGTAIGLVLGGGGARGSSHVGVIRSLVEAGIPIDMVGGTSIGSLVGAVWADEPNPTALTRRIREWSMKMKSLWQLIDLTYPVASMFTGSSFNKGIERVFKDRQIEDLWIPYYCITTDITASKMRVHTAGSLWRYVRASMSLSGYLPPLCDPVDGHLLLDGGYVNNLPADVMKAMGAQKIFACDVGSIDDTDLFNYGDSLSGWWLLWSRFYPWAKPVKVPNIAEIQSRLAYVSCNRQLEEVKVSGYCEYLRPPIDKYATMHFERFDEIMEVGYNYAKAVFTAWTTTGVIGDLFKERDRANSISSPKAQTHRPHAVPREAKFTDLAELISRIDEPNFDFPRAVMSEGASDDSDDDRMSVTSEPVIGTMAQRVRSRGYRSDAASEGHSVCASEEFQVAPEMDTDIQDLTEDLDLATQEDPFVSETKDKDI